MSEAVLSQILIIVLIVAVIALIAVLWRTFEVLGDIKVASGILAKRAIEADKAIGRAIGTASSIAEGIKGFLLSLGFVQNLKDNFMNNSKSKEEK